MTIKFAHFSFVHDHHVPVLVQYYVRRFRTRFDHADIRRLFVHIRKEAGGEEDQQRNMEHILFRQIHHVAHGNILDLYRPHIQ